MRRPAVAFLLFAITVMTACSAPPSTSATSAPTVSATPGLTLEQVVELARKEGKLAISDSSPEAQFGPVIAAFKQKYPFIEVQHLSQASAEAIQRMTQEVNANIPATADVVIGGLAQLGVPEQQGLLLETPWDKLGVAPALVGSNAQVKALGALTVFVYNTTLVKDADVPKTWDDLASDKWKGKVGLFATGDIAADLSLSIGEPKATDLWTKLVQQSTLYATPPDVATKVASGEVSIGLVRIQQARAQVQRRAPVAVKIPEPAPFSTLAAVTPKTAKNPNAARLYIQWLTTPEGANTYEKATLRGNPLVSGSDAANDVRGITIVTWDAKRQTVEERARLEAKFLQIAQRGGR